MILSTRANIIYALINQLIVQYQYIHTVLGNMVIALQEEADANS